MFQKVENERKTMQLISDQFNTSGKSHDAHSLQFENDSFLSVFLPDLTG